MCPLSRALFEPGGCPFHVQPVHNSHTYLFFASQYPHFHACVAKCQRQTRRATPKIFDFKTNLELDASENKALMTASE